jgi:beta-phosphoglucomutase
VTATLFDFNGVLVDDEHVHLAAFRDVLRPLGLGVTDADYNDRYLGFDDVGAFRAILTDAGRAFTDADVRALVEAKKPAYMKRIGAELRIFDGAADLVRRRAERGTVGIVSGALEAEIRYCLARMGVLDRVAFIVSAEMCAECKPHPEGYLEALRRLQLQPSSAGDARSAGRVRGVVVIEDSLAGIQSARAASLRCAAVTHSYPRAQLEAAGADVVAASLAELTDALLDGSDA